MFSQYEYSIPKEAIGNTLIELAETNNKICVFSSDVSKSVNVYEFSQAHPDRFFEMGIAEQSTVSAAGGMAIEGFIPVYVALSIFSNGMTFPQTRQVCNNNLNVKIIGTHAGVDDGADGPGHHSTEDMAISRVIPRMTVLCPSDENEVAAAIRAMIDMEGPCYMRVAREVQPIIHDKDIKFEIGKAEILYDEGDDFAIIFEGSALEQALEGWEASKNTGKKGKLINIRSIKPLDEECVRKVADMVDTIITVENHSIKGGLYSVICETLAGEKHKAVVKPVGFHDQFMESGPSAGIKEKYGLNAKAIVDYIN
ncbi:transketolase [Pseudobutyrivibrio sp. ACV-2]|uniref:transketolase family protein n=1 Tax=Pseudobutyrivibrio sp. ACV-2 TaxID=1520801 RepID=UPI000897173C|nr:transketolase C-terminal domain-containing protein [Pseudobutyrivibrio sp. ACV-2]SEA52446.1 transketolase [Pseudobutyrivibrio sp. ACV-2]